MENIHIGIFIKKLRKQQRMTQEELAFDIIDRTALSKLERGLVIPHRKSLIALLEKLGYDTSIINNFFLDDKEVEVQKIVNRIQLCTANRNTEEVDELLALLENNTQYMSQKLNRQFVISSKASNLINKGGEIKETVKLLHEALKITIPVFVEKDIDEYYVTNEELHIINMLAITHGKNGEVEKAIDILYSLKNNLDKNCVDTNRLGKQYPLIIYNLTKYLGIVGRRDEAIELCDVGYAICLKTAQFFFLPHILHNKAVNLFEIGNREDCETLLRQVYHLSCAYKDYECAEITRSYALDKLGVYL